MDPTSTIIERIKTLEPENASKIIEYFLLQDIAHTDLIRMSFAPDARIEELCRKAKSELGLQLPQGSTLNPYARSFDKPLSSSSTRNEFLDFSRNPNIPALFPSLIRDNPNFNSNPFLDGSSQQHQQLSFSANDAYLGGLVDGFGSLGGFGSPTQQSMIGGQFMGDFGSQMSNIQGSREFGVEGGFASPSEQQRMIAAQPVADFGSQMSNRQGSRQFEVEGGFGSPSEQQSMIASQFMGAFGSQVLNRQGSRDFGVEGGFVSPSEQQRMIAAQSVADFGSQMSNRQGSGQFGVERGFRSPSEQQSMIAGQLMRGFGSPMSNRQGSGKFGVERGYCHSPGSHEREDLVSKKIFLSYPLGSSVTDEDVSNYFSKFGEVAGVFIPNKQQQGTFGFVTFTNAESVRTILDEGNPHFIGESTVCVKQYKRKGNSSPLSPSLTPNTLRVEGGYWHNLGRQKRNVSVSRKIYLTFPSESSFFTDKDVANYFNKFGEVEAVNIPNLQQRMFGFVTFANDETVRTILALGNPHIIRGSYVTVKPYKEKEESTEQQQQPTFHERTLENSLFESPKQSTETPQTKSDTEQDKEVS